MVVAIVEGMFRQKECRKHQLTVNMITIPFELQMRVEIVREELLSWFNVSTPKGDPRVHSLNIHSRCSGFSRQ